MVNVKQYNAHGAQFITLDDGERETTILRKEGETVEQCLTRYARDYDHQKTLAARRAEFCREAIASWGSAVLAAGAL